MPGLSPSKSVDVNVLAGLFSNTTNSYKFLYFQALLSMCRNADFKDRLISLDDLAVEMIAIAWYPYKYFRLSFGLQDKIGEVTDQLQFETKGQSIGSYANQKRLREHIEEQANTIGLSRLLRYVPFRLLNPFFRNETSGMSDAKRDKAILRLTNKCFSETKPLYRFRSEGKHGPGVIEIHPDWDDYIRKNHSIVKGWAERQWLAFLQKRNPTTPALSEKLCPPTQRASLTRQRQFWAFALTSEPMCCIYSGEPLHPENHALDHFLPWSYVCHDQLWNLVPSSPGINSSKGNSIPSEKYLECLAKMHTKALKIIINSPEITPNRLRNIIEPYLSDLKVPKHQLTNGEVMRQSYESLLLPQMNLARQSGFPADWIH